VTADERVRIEPTSIRAAVARRMAASKREAPHFYVSTEIEMDRALDAVRARKHRGGGTGRVTVTAVLVRAAALALAENPTFNAVWDGDAVYQVDRLNIGVAIALDEGLIAPALLDCRDRDLDTIAADLSDLQARARAGKLRATEISTATFTVSNLGMFDVSAFAAIITPPQVAILAVGRTEPRPVVREGEVVVRQVMTATVSADHRVVDGAGVARFLGTLKARLEAPEEWTASA
jgi:pyruvate dehydrogenase E2 component (dihydrolipoamide acetyltransferase)